MMIIELRQAAEEEEEYNEDFKIPTEGEDDEEFEMNYHKGGLSRAMRRNMRMRYRDNMSGGMRMRRSRRR